MDGEGQVWRDERRHGLREPRGTGTWKLTLSLFAELFMLCRELEMMLIKVLCWHSNPPHNDPSSLTPSTKYDKRKDLEAVIIHEWSYSR